jgi:hypothetical protein
MLLEGGIPFEGLAGDSSLISSKINFVKSVLLIFPFNLSCFCELFYHAFARDVERGGAGRGIGHKIEIRLLSAPLMLIQLPPLKMTGV